jgi:hypothetical protein
MGRFVTYLLVALSVSLLIAGRCFALDVRQVDWNGHKVLFATGEIIQGDAQKIAVALAQVKPLPHGLPVLLLSSNGGSVGEALRISQVFSEKPVHTVIPAGARCASACASIVFIAGSIRTVEQGGLLGQHSCSAGGVANQECNDMLASHALAHGVSHGSVAAFVTYASPADMIWFSRSDADCWGLTRYPFSRESGFDKSDPCAIKGITGRKPRAQSAWRIDFKGDGYRAFLRPASDDERELELNLYCDEKVPSTLFLSMDIQGPATTIRSAVSGATLDAPPVVSTGVPFEVSQVDREFSRLIMRIETRDVIPFLTQSDRMQLRLALKPPYQPIVATTYLSGSRGALLFAANHCMNKR